MRLTSPQNILDFWFGSDRSKFNEAAHIQQLFGVWFSRSNPSVEATFIEEAAQIDALAHPSSLGEEWFTPEGIILYYLQYHAYCNSKLN